MEKPIEKYEKKFIKLLKEMEEELGGNLIAEVRSGINETQNADTGWLPVSKKVYNFSVRTNNGFTL